MGELGSVASVEACAGSVAGGWYMAARLGRPGAAVGVEVDTGEFGAACVGQLGASAAHVVDLGHVAPRARAERPVSAARARHGALLGQGIISSR
ncbi:hypothetical protein [Sorangium sp. So ce117]|uniref:hypothetical protein n=1 Tax=Sorangium sp. So ce117 TaxID=3133277 RepID=UPI003F639F96